MPSCLGLAAADITTVAAAPSEICDALPAVMVPSLANAGRRLAERLGGGAGTHALVGVDEDRVALALRDLDGRDLLGETAFLHGRGRARSWLLAATSSCMSRVRPPSSPV